jgi:RNA 2',3'-cyclic 3'-phosphodiesterase
VSDAPRARIFLALWPDPAVRDALAAAAGRAQAECAGRTTPAAKLHVTLFFVGEIERARVAAVQSCAAAVRSPRFALDMGVLGYWRHNRIVWAGARQTPAALESLVSQLTANLALEGIRAEERRFVAHATLVRNARSAPANPTLDVPAWEVGAFALVESVRENRGVRYDVLAQWSLAPPL